MHVQMKPIGSIQPVLHFGRLCVVTLSILFTVASYGADSGQTPAGATSIQTEHFELGPSDDTSKPSLKIDIESMELPASSQSADEILKVVSEKHKNKDATIFLSTDNEQLIKKSITNQELQSDRFVAVPIEDIDSQSLSVVERSKFSTLVKKYSSLAADSIRADKFGFFIMTCTTANESLIWIHSTHLNKFEKTANVVYTVALSLAFGLNKDAWNTATKPIKNFYRNLVKPENISATNPKELAVKFLGNLTLGALVTSIRVPLISMDQIIHQGLQLHYFQTPLLLTALTTAALFTWSEHLAMIDENSSPITKFVFRRVNEFRCGVLAILATSAALLSPAEYGITPRITMAGVGVIGALVYFNAEKITDWIESRPSLQSFRKKLANSKKYNFEALQCRMLFAE